MLFYIFARLLDWYTPGDLFKINFGKPGVCRCEGWDVGVVGVSELLGRLPWINCRKPWEHHQQLPPTLIIYIISSWAASSWNPSNSNYVVLQFTRIFLKQILWLRLYNKSRWNFVHSINKGETLSGWILIPIVCYCCWFRSIAFCVAYACVYNSSLSACYR